MSRKLAALLAVLLAALAAASLTVGLLYWALDSVRRKPQSKVPLPAPSATSPLPAAPRAPGSPDRLPWH